MEQCAYTSGLCYLFARVAHGLMGGTPSVLWTTEPAVLDRHDWPADEPLELHAFLLLDNGLALDAEGVRSVEEMCKAFGLRSVRHHRIESVPASTLGSGVDPGAQKRLETRLKALGWHRGPPAATGALGAPGVYAAAHAQLDAWWPRWKAAGEIPADPPPFLPSKPTKRLLKP